MQDRGFTPLIIKETINNGQTFPTRSGTIGQGDCLKRKTGSASREDQA
jgi:hypothetical protein